MMIQPMVEGQGEETAVPVLLRRLRDEAQVWGLEVGRPHRRRRTQLVRRDSLQVAVRVAVLRQDCAGILVLFDADDDCPKDLGPILEGWARETAGGRPCAVVMANREYEAWFLAGPSVACSAAWTGRDPSRCNLASEHGGAPRCQGRAGTTHVARRQLFRHG